MFIQNAVKQLTRLLQELKLRHMYSQTSPFLQS